MAQRLGLKVVAEGVETEAVFRELRAMGCQHAQGYFISKSLPPEQVPQFFADWASLMKSDPIREENALPKIAIIQALLSDILNDNGEDDSTLVLSDLGSNGALDEDSTLQLVSKIPALVLQGRVAGALARCQAALHRLERKPDRIALKGKILQLRQLLEQDLICKDDLELSTADGPVRLLARRAALIGRPSKAKAVDIPVGCRWFSRGEKNLRLYAEGEDWFVEDLGSTNGSSIGDRPLQPDRPYKLPYGETLIEIGKRAGSTAPIALRLRRPPTCPGAIVMTLLADDARLNDASEENQWPSWKEDLRTTWVVFDGRISLGASKNCAVVLSDAGADTAAEIWFHEGFWIAPSPNVPLSIAEAPFTEEAPLPAGADLSVGGARLRVEIFPPVMLSVPYQPRFSSRKIEVERLMSFIQAILDKANRQGRVASKGDDGAGDATLSISASDAGWSAELADGEGVRWKRQASCVPESTAATSTERLAEAVARFGADQPQANVARVVLFIDDPDLELVDHRFAKLNNFEPRGLREFGSQQVGGRPVVFGSLQFGDSSAREIQKRVLGFLPEEKLASYFFSLGKMATALVAVVPGGACALRAESHEGGIFATLRVHGYFSTLLIANAQTGIIAMRQFSFGSLSLAQAYAAEHGSSLTESSAALGSKIPPAARGRRQGRRGARTPDRHLCRTLTAAAAIA